jgi:hypothetical protein
LARLASAEFRIHRRKTSVEKKDNVLQKEYVEVFEEIREIAGLL